MFGAAPVGPGIHRTMRRVAIVEDDNRLSLSSLLGGIQAFEKDEDKQIITINVSGNIFQTQLGTLMKIPNTILCNEAVKLSSMDKEADTEFELYLDRNPEVFSAILNYYRTQELHVPLSQCITLFRHELEFFEISPEKLAPCCRKVYCDFFQDLETRKEMNIAIREYNWEPKHKKLSYKSILWNLIANAQFSNIARIYSTLQYILILVSIYVVLDRSQLSQRQRNSLSDVLQHYCPGLLSMDLSLECSDRGKLASVLQYRQDAMWNSSVCPLRFLSKKMQYYCSSHPSLYSHVIECICIVFFTVDFFLRLYSCPCRKTYMLRLTTWWEIAYLLPATFVTVVWLVDQDIWIRPDRGYINCKVYLAVQLFLFLRILRVARFSKASRTFRIFLLSLRSSMLELFSLVLLMAITIAVFGVFEYVLEVTEESGVTDMFTATYWGVLTLCTVGYGDIIPNGWGGRFMAAACGLCGLLVLGMPIPVITSKFHSFYAFRISQDHEENEIEDPDKQKQQPIILESRRPMNQIPSVASNASVSDVKRMDQLHALPLAMTSMTNVILPGQKT